ncbi:hypothetical protein IGB42_01948 [Andreprevotia sp. IGB-42]|uniref:VOC family protein n=1 Tax=Andreprevotia sp. IGB-42 TaxID=2497473 RepID=UPI001356A746|nr:VOC family protein [Andreprevotia sp. IGB-42]KAF0813597.1 hypothetical protein IGB42_01948 [Andreprevotia sp. IGB-42]
MPEVIGIDHVYIAVSDMRRSEAFYDQVLLTVLGFRKNACTLAGDPHIQYYNRHFGYVLRPARSDAGLEVPGSDQRQRPGLHHLCLRVQSAADVAEVAHAMQQMGIAATDAALYPDYAVDYTATFFTDPDGLRLEVTNYRQERQQRHDCWNHPA